MITSINEWRLKKKMSGIETGLDTIFTATSAPFKFGIGATNEVGFDLKRLGVTNALLVTDKNVKELGIAERIASIIEEEDIKVDVFDGVHIEPTDESMLEAIRFAEGKGYDGFVGLGGGSSIDTAKCVNLFTTYPEPLMAYVNPPIGEGKRVPGPLRPLLAIPTTAGTGSEGTPVIVLDFLELKLKTGISNPYIRPTMGVVDPLLTLSLPPEVTASTGMDVLTHSLECFTARDYTTRPKPATPADRAGYVGSNPISDAVAAAAIEIVGKYLRRAVSMGNDLEARVNMALGATMAGVGFGNAGVHIPHSMGYPIAGMVKEWTPPGFKGVDYPMVPHGIAVTVGAPAAMKFTVPADMEKHALVVQLLGEDIEDLSLREAAMGLPEVLIDLMKDINFPNGVGALGFDERDIPKLVEGTIKQQRLLVCSPRPVTEADLEQMFEDAMSYW